MSSEAEKPKAEAAKIVEFQLKLERPENARVDESAAQINPIEETLTPGQEFVGRMVSLARYHERVWRMAQTTGHVNLAALSVLLAEIAVAAESGSPTLAQLHLEWKTEGPDGSPGSKSQSFSVTREEHIKAIQEFMRIKGVAQEVLHESLLQQIVNELELLESRVVRNYYRGAGKSALSSHSLNFSQILDAKSIEELHAQIVDEAVQEHMRKSLKDRLRVYSDSMKMDLQAQCATIPLAREAVLRRHAIVHAGRVATRQYVDGYRAIKGLPNSFAAPVEGQPIQLTRDYVLSAWSSVFVAGVVLMHLWSVCESRRLGREDSEVRADDWLSNAAYDCLEQSLWAPVVQIGEYAFKRTMKSVGGRLRLMVNVAQAYKWDGMEAKCDELLATHDWATQAAEYQLCVCALKGDRAGFEASLKLAASGGRIAPHELLEWPVFREVRKADWFDSAVKAALGPLASKSVVRVRSELMDHNPDLRLKDIQKWVVAIGRRAGKKRPKRGPRAGETLHAAGGTSPADGAGDK